MLAFSRSDLSFHRHNCGQGISLVFPRQTTEITIQKVDALIGEQGIPCAEIPGVSILKKARQRLVMRADLPQGSRIVKLFPLRNPVSMLKHRKYAWREFLNYEKARARGIAVPGVDAFLRQRRFGFVTLSGLIIEDLGSAQDVLQLSENTGYQQAAVKAIPALCALWQAGVNHVDLRDENLILTPDGFCIIDWQYASFTEQQADWLLEYLAGYFIRKAPEADQEALIGEWLQDLYETAGHPLPFAMFRKRIEVILAHRPSVTARLRLKEYRVDQ